MSNRKPKDIRIKVRQNWYQFWLPEYIVLPSNHEVFDELEQTAAYLRQAAVDVINYSNKMHRESTIDKNPSVVQSVTPPKTPKPAQPAHRHIHIKDEAELNGVTGGDMYIEPPSEYAVEFNPDLNPTWTPEQNNGNVAIVEPAYVRTMRGRQINDLRKLQGK